MTIEEIKNHLVTGDYIKIARMVGYTPDKLNAGRKYVSDVLNGKRGSDKGIGKMILDAAIKVAEFNKELFNNN